MCQDTWPILIPIDASYREEFNGINFNLQNFETIEKNGKTKAYFPKGPVSIFTWLERQEHELSKTEIKLLPPLKDEKI